MSFLANAAKAVLPIAGAVLPFIPGGAALTPFVGAADAALNAVDPSPQQNPLASILGAVGPAVASNALAKNNLGQAEAIMNSAFDKTNAARGTIIDDFMSRMKGMTDPSLAKQTPPQIDPTKFAGVTAPMLSGALGARPGMAPSMTQQPNNFYAQALAMLQGMNPAAQAQAAPAAQAPAVPQAAPPPAPQQPKPQQPTPIQQQQLAMNQNPNMMGADARGGYLISGDGTKYYLENGQWVTGGTTTPPQPWTPPAPAATPTQPTFGGFRQLVSAGQPPATGVNSGGASPFAQRMVQ